MGRRVSVNALAVLVVALMILAGWSVWHQSAPEPVLTVHAASVALEAIPCGRELDVSVTITNNGRRDCRILGSEFC